MALLRFPPTRTAFADTRGAVYVEFLLAFMPVFMLFLATTQLSLLTAAKLVVQHAATSAARSAVVILNDGADELSKVPRGSLTEEASSVTSAGDLLVALDLPGAGSALGGASDDDADRITQHGARMVPIRASAYFPLFALSPDASVLEGSPANDVATSLSSELGRRAAAAFAYTRAATVVSVLTRPGSEQLPVEIEPKAAVTVRVTYVVHCGVPLARRLICNSLSELVARDESAPDDSEDGKTKLVRRFTEVEDRSGFEQLATSGQRFIVFEAEATLPNQGADYEPKVEEQEED